MKADLKVRNIVMKLPLPVKKIRGTEGLTLIELMLTVGLMMLIVSMVTATYLLSVNTSRDVIDITTSAIDSRLIMYRISKDIRETVDISEAETDTITFKSNIDDDDNYETLTYSLVKPGGAGSYTLFRTVDAGSPRIVASNIIYGDIFTYYTDIDIPVGGMTSVSGEELENIKIIKIEFSIDQTGTVTERTMELKTHITLRNRV